MFVDWRGIGKQPGHSIRTLKTLYEIVRRVPSQPISQLAGAELDRLESGLQPAWDQQAGELYLAPAYPHVDPVGQPRHREHQTVGNWEAILMGTATANNLAEITPSANIVAVDDVQCLAGRPCVLHRLGETVGAVLDVGQRQTR